MAGSAPRTWRAVAAGAAGLPGQAGRRRPGHEVPSAGLTPEERTEGEPVDVGDRPDDEDPLGATSATTTPSDEPDPWAQYLREAQSESDRWWHWDDNAWHGHVWSDDEWRAWRQNDYGSRRTSWGTTSTGRLSDQQLRDFNVAEVKHTTANAGGKWLGTSGHDAPGSSPSEGLGAWQSGSRPAEKLAVPEFDGEVGSDQDLGREARSFVRRIQVWLRCTKLPVCQQGLALYSALKGKAWVCAEELDVDVLGSERGVAYFLEWVQARYMELEVTKISALMAELFKKCKRRPEQSVRDFNVEFERLVLRLHEVRCELPPLVKAWLYVDKLRLTEAEELALLSSVNNEFDVKKLQQAALIQDRGYRRPGGHDAGGSRSTWKGARWGRQSVHMTEGGNDGSSDGEPHDNHPDESDDNLVDEDTAAAHHSAYLSYQAAREKYREAMKGRGTDQTELKRRAEERLKQAKMRSFCGACKRRGHWHKDPECPLRGRSGDNTKGDGDQKTQQAHVCNMVYMCGTEQAGSRPNTTGPSGQEDTPAYAKHTAQEFLSVQVEEHYSDYAEPTAREFMPVQIEEHYSDYGEHVARGPMIVQNKEVASRLGNSFDGDPVFMTTRAPSGSGADDVDLAAIVDTACTRTVAGYGWYEAYCAKMDDLNLEVHVRDVEDRFKFGASRIYVSKFAVDAWFCIERRWFMVSVAVVPCKVPLLFSKPVLGGLGMVYHVSEQKVDLKSLGLEAISVRSGRTGHPVLPTAQFSGEGPPIRGVPDYDLVWCPPVTAYMTVLEPLQGTSTLEAPPATPVPRLFYPKKLADEVREMLVGEWGLGGHAFIAWWKGANQSRDFWVETGEEFIRVHVVPRKHRFDPSQWSTQHTHLKDALLDRLGAVRITEAIPCLAEGVVVKCESDVWQWKSNTELAEGSAFAALGLWVGRSRFGKPQTVKSTSDRTQIRTLDAQRPTHVSQEEVAMEDAEGGVDGRAGGVRRPGPSKVDGAGAPQHGGGTTSPTSAGDGEQGPDGRDYEDDVGAVDRRSKKEQHCLATTAHTGPADADAPGPRVDRGSDDRPVRPVQGMVLQRGPARLPGVDDPGDQDGQQPSRPGTAGQLGKGMDQEAGIRASDPGAQGGGRPRGECEDSTTAGCKPDQRDVDDQHGKLGWILGGAKALLQAGKTRSWSGRGTRTQFHGARAAPAGAGGDVGPRSPTGGPSAEARCGPEIGSSGAEDVNPAEGDHVGAEVDLQVTMDGTSEDCDDGKNTWEGAFYTILHGSDGSDSEDPKERARAGQRRRRYLEAPRRQRVQHCAGVLGHCLTVWMTLMTSHVAEAVAAPARDAWAVLQSQHHDPAEGSRADVLELFAGKARITEAFARRRGAALQPRDICYGHDLRQPAIQEEILDDIIRERPHLVWAAPPCTAWCAFARLNFTPQERRRRQAREVVFLRFLGRVQDLQRNLRGHVIIENPQTSELWDHPIVRGWRALPGSDEFVTDMCQYGMRSADGQELLRKPVKLLTTHVGFRGQLHRRCEGSHDHRTIGGRDTGHSAHYPTAFGTAVFRALSEVRRLGQDSGTQEVLAVDREDDVAEGQEIGAPAITFRGKVNNGVASTVRRIHQNLGHPPNRELVRHLRLSGANAAMIQAAQQLVCRSCERSTRAKLARVATPATYLDFNEWIAIDIVWLETADYEGANLPALNVVDLASTYQQVIPLKSTKAEHATKGLLEGWVAWAGPPKTILADLDSAFKGAFLEAMDRYGVGVRCAAGQAHWQNGVAERHGAAWKQMWSKVVEATKTLREEVPEAVSVVNNAKNTLRNRAGFSPRQWVFGSNGHRDDDDGTHNYDIATPDTRFARLQAIRTAAKTAFFETRAQDAVRRASAHRPRVEGHPFEPGALVYFFRLRRPGKGKKPKPTWMGPATVIGREGSNYWPGVAGVSLSPRNT